MICSALQLVVCYLMFAGGVNDIIFFFNCSEHSLESHVEGRQPSAISFSVPIGE